MPQLDISRQAINDLAEIFSYSVAQFGDDVGERYARGFYEAFDRLVETPRIGAPSNEAPNLRALSHRSHRIFYTFQDDTVLIVRILHKARDAQQLLS